MIRSAVASLDASIDLRVFAPGPLGMRPSAPFTPELLERAAALEAFDLSRVRTRLAKDGVMPASWIDEAILEFRRYLALQLLDAGAVYMPSKQVDEVWHACILHTRLYAELCQEVFGHFIHHDPVQAPDLEEAWESFARPYRLLFGEPGRLWQMWYRPDVQLDAGASR